MKSNKLGLLTTKIGSGITPRGGQSVYQDKGTHLIRSQNIYNHKFKKKGLVCISQEIADKMKSVEIMKDDVLINITGDSVARTHMIPDELLPARVNQHVSILRTKPELNPHYLYYFLINPFTQNHLLGISGIGGTRNAITKDMLYNLIIEYPDHTTQEKIVKQLNTIKNKLTVLKKQNEILEQIAQTIFNSWFVDFDGIEEFEDSELGKIPKGWTVTTFKNMADIVKGFSYKGIEKFDNVQGFEFVTLNSIKEGGGFKKKFKWLKSDRLKERHFVKEMDLIIANTEQTKDARLLATPALVQFSYDYDQQTAVYSHHISKIKEKIQNSKFYLHSFFLYFQQSIANAYHTGTGVWGFDHIGFENNYLILQPDSKILEKFENISFELHAQIIENEKSISVLTNTRNILLPKLMSGEIRV